MILRGNKTIIMLIGAALLLLQFAAGIRPAAAAEEQDDNVVLLQTAGTAVKAGDSFELTVAVQHAVDVNGIQFRLTFDPSNVELTSASFVPAGGFRYIAGATYDKAGGTVAVPLVDTGSTADPIALEKVGTLTFKAKQAGRADFALGDIIVVNHQSRTVQHNGNATLSVAVSEQGSGGNGGDPGSVSGNAGTGTPASANSRCAQPVVEEGIAYCKLSEADWQAAGTVLAGTGRAASFTLGLSAGASGYELRLPASAWLAAGQPDLVMHSPLGVVRFPAKMLRADELKGAAVAAFRIALLPGSAVSAYDSTLPGRLTGQAIRIQVLLDGKPSASRPLDTPITIGLPASAVQDETPVVWLLASERISNEATPAALAASRYDADAHLVLAASNLMGDFELRTGPAGFSDIANSFARADIDYLFAAGIVNGRSATLFAPKTVLTRAEWAKMLVSALNLKQQVTTTVGSTSFDDVPAQHYAAAAIRTVVSLGIANGVGAGRFAPDRPITRQELFVMIARALQSQKFPLAENGLAGRLSGFKDAKSVSPYARDSFEKLLEAGIVRGTGDLLWPLAHTTREQAAAILGRSLTLMAPTMEELP